MTVGRIWNPASTAWVQDRGDDAPARIRCQHIEDERDVASTGGFRFDQTTRCPSALSSRSFLPVLIVHPGRTGEIDIPPSTICPGIFAFSRFNGTCRRDEHRRSGISRLAHEAFHDPDPG